MAGIKITEYIWSIFNSAWHLIKAKQLLAVIMVILIFPHITRSPMSFLTEQCYLPAHMCACVCVRMHTRALGYYFPLGIPCLLSPDITYSEYINQTCNV